MLGINNELEKIFIPRGAEVEPVIFPALVLVFRSLYPLVCRDEREIEPGLVFFTINGRGDRGCCPVGGLGRCRYVIIGNLDDDVTTASKATYWATASTIWKDPSLWGTAVLLDHDVAAGEIETGVEEQITEKPSSFELSQNYPNPFNPTTTIDYTIDRRSHVELAVFTTIGQRVAKLVDARVEAGLHSVRFDASKLSSGVYFYRLKTNNNIIPKTLMLLR